MAFGVRVDMDQLKIQIKRCLKTLADEEMCVRMHMGNHLIFTGMNFSKNRRKSEETRNEGNSLFRQSSHDSRTHHKILHLYNESIAYAPNESEELATAYGNKSAILLHIRKYAESIVEANKALKVTKNNSLKVKLLCRKAECYTARGSFEGVKCLEKAKFLLSKEDLSDQLDKCLEGLITKTQLIVDAGKRDPSVVYEKDEVMSRLVKEAEKADVWKNVRVAYSPEHGRHLVAVRDFKPGEIVTVEKPYFNGLVEWLIFIRCYNCLEYLWTAVPCDHCAYRLYCSEECKQEAWNLFHDMDCTVLRSMKEGALIEGDLAHVRPLISFFIRAFKEAGSIEQFLIDVQDLDNHEAQPTGFPSNGKVATYKSLYLLPCRELPGEEYEICMKRAAVALLGIAKYTDILGTRYDFKDIKKLRRNDTAIFVGALLFKFSWVMKSRTTMNLLTDPSEPPPTIGPDGKLPPLCESIKPLNFLFPLVCVPNCRGVPASKNRHLMYALQPIKKGTMLTSSSKSVYEKLKKKERMKNKLQELNHRAQSCRACEEDWFEKELTVPDFLKEMGDESIIGTALIREIQLIRERSNDGQEMIAKTIDLVGRAWQYFSMPSSLLLEITSILMKMFDHIFEPDFENIPPCSK